MSFVYLLQWWYGRGWALQWRLAGLRTSKIADAFSEETLFRTLFAPWRRITTDTDGRGGLDAQVQAFVDNLISRFVGFMIRSMVLIGGTVAVIVVGLGSLLLAAVWPAIPLLGIVFIGMALGVI